MTDRRPDFTAAIAEAIAQRQARPEIRIEPGRLPDGSVREHHWSWAEEEIRARQKRFLELNIGD